MDFEIIVQWAGGLLAYSALGIILFGIWRGTRRKAGHASGYAASWLRSSIFYFALTVFFFWIAYLGWVKLPLEFNVQTRVVMLVIGSLLYFPGLLFLLWARLTLGKNYFVSSGLGAQLFADHDLIKTGPYAVVRHPMYAGLIVAAIGSLLIYFTWTTVYFACFAPFLFIRAWREEQALSGKFGEQWKEYCTQVPAFIPRLRK